jgi:hypothetical protein
VHHCSSAAFNRCHGVRVPQTSCCRQYVAVPPKGESKGGKFLTFVYGLRRLPGQAAPLSAPVRRPAAPHYLLQHVDAFAHDKSRISTGAATLTLPMQLGSETQSVHTCVSLLGQCYIVCALTARQCGMRHM